MFDFLLLILGFIFVFFLPGFLVIETFGKSLTPIQKIPLVMLLSVLISAYLVYFVSLFLGYSRFSILFSIGLLCPWLVIVTKFKKNELITKTKDLFKEHRAGLVISIVIFFIFLVALYPAIFYRSKDYFVMSGVNWQDTALHLSIMETISQGNFPPQAPYFSGRPLNYYYFTDFHSAILETLYGKFSPRIFIIDNPFFVFIYVLSIYTLAFSLTENKRTSIIAMLLGIFIGNFMFLKFIQDLISQPTSNIFSQAIQLISAKGYTLEYGQLIQVVPMTDLMLQNRPLMVGFPAAVLTGLLLFKGYKEAKTAYVVLAGVMTAMLIKFQLFALVVNAIAFILVNCLFLRKISLRQQLKLLLMYGLSALVLTVLMMVLIKSETSIINIFIQNIMLPTWDKDKDLLWHLQFYMANFGLPFLIAMFLFFKTNFTSWGKESLEYKFLIYLMVILFVIPHLVSFTIFGEDMFKFFFFMFIPISILNGIFLSKIWSINNLYRFAVIIVIFISILTSMLALSNSFLNKNLGYRISDYKAGLWIREQTPINSVFITLPTVHSPISEIGGRLRVLSYINWPYSHGFNVGEDNVFTREANIEKLYSNPADTTSMVKIIHKYGTAYIYYGEEERIKYPKAEKLLDSSPILQLVYIANRVKIYSLKINS